MCIEMAWASGENGLVPYGQNGANGGCKWRVGMGQTEVRLGVWHKECLGQRRDYGGVCATMKDRKQ